MFRFSVVVFFSALLAGCGAVARVETQQNYHASVADYRSCLAADPSKCEGKRLIAEADERALNNVSGRAVNLNVQQR